MAKTKTKAARTPAPKPAAGTGPKPELRIGLIGCGFMGRAHANAIRQQPHFFRDAGRTPVLQAVCARNEESVRAFAATWDARSFETDWRTLVARDDIDAVDICTPNDSHMEIALACIKHGKMIL